MSGNGGLQVSWSLRALAPSAAVLLLGAAAMAKEVAVTADAGLNIRGTALPACAKADDQLHLQIGEASLRFPRSAVMTVMPAAASTVTQNSDGSLAVMLPGQVGCPNAPLRTAMAVIGPTADLPMGAMLTETAPREGLSRTAQGLLGLRDRKECATQGNGLGRCEGSQSIDGQRVPVIYLLAEDAGETINSGAPLYALCRQAEKLECEIADDVEGRVSVRMMLPAGAPDLALLKAERQRLLAFIANARF